MGINLRYGPMDWDSKNQTYNFTGSHVTGFNSGDFFGKTWYVCGTSGNDGENSGLTPHSAFKTIQKALDTQISFRASKVSGWNWGSKIKILPGTYVESLDGALVDVAIMGVGMTNGAVKITPSDGSSWAGTTMTNSSISNLTMRSSSSTNKTYAAFRCMIMTDSVISGCRFQSGATGTVTTTAFRIGDEAGTYTDSTADQMLRSKFIFNDISSLAGGYCFYYGVVFGASVQTDAGTGGNTRSATGSVIGWNNINAETYAILLNTNKNSGGSFYIIGNNCMGAHLERGNCAKSAIHAVDPDTGENVLIKVIGNMCNSDDGISGFDSHNMMNNLSAIHLTNSVGQYPAHA